MNRGQPLHLLVVEDDEKLTELLCEKLHRSTAALFQVATAGRLGPAIHRLRETKVDLVLLDLDLPDSRGFDTFAHIHAESPDVPVIILSNADPDAEQLAVRTVQHGAQDYLVKRDVHAAGFELLLRAIQYALERKRTQRELRQSYDNLEKRVAERTEELVRANEKLRREVADRKRAEEALMEGNRRLAEAIEQVRRTQGHVIQRERLHAIGRMADGIAHDFNNALTPILGFSELLLLSPEKLADSETVCDYLRRIHSAASDSAKVVARLRDFYRVRDDVEAMEKVSVNELIGQAISLTQPRWKDQALAAGVTIRIETDLQDVQPVSGNEAELREMLTSLIFNAVDAIRKQGAIVFRTFQRDKQVVVEISDTGTGMSEAVKARCMEPFFSTKTEHGSGLGLGIVYGIVRRHEGDIHIDSELGKGTTISVSLPMQNESQPVAQAVPEPGPPRNLRILVAEDDPLVREVLTAYLREDNHIVEATEHGVEALEKFPGGNFQLVLTDRAMPEMNGDQVAMEIKKIDPQMPVILLTGFGDVMSGAGELPEGVDMVVGKPFTLDSLRDAIAKVMRKIPSADARI